jgi:hypothetical protein
MRMGNKAKIKVKKEKRAVEIAMSFARLWYVLPGFV